MQTQKDATSTKNDLIQGDIASKLKSMTVPVVMGMILLMTFSLVDTYFVSLIGTNELAAISFTFPVTFTVISLTIGLGIGTSAVIGKAMGQSETSQAKRMATASLMLGILMVGSLATLGYISIPLIFSLMGATDPLLGLIYDYMSVWYLSAVFMSVPMIGNSVLRASGDTTTPSVIMAMGGAINAILDPILIFGWLGFPAMGIMGAAVATCIAWSVCAVYLVYLLGFKRNLMEPSWLSWRSFISTVKPILSIGLPAAGSNMLTPIAGAIVTAIVATHGAEAVAAWGVGSRIESIATIVVLALSMSLPPFISQNFGANQSHRIIDAYRMCINFVLLWQLLVFVILAVSSAYVAGMFADDEQVIHLLALFLLIVPLGYGVQGIIILTNSSFNAMHEPMSAVWLSIIRLFVFFVPFAFIGSELFGMKGLLIGCVIANFLTAIVSYTWFNKRLMKFKLVCQVDVQSK